MRETRQHCQWCGVVWCAVCLRYAAGVRFRIFCLSLIVINLQTKIWKYNGCETWSVTLNEERSLRVFENRVLREVFGPKREEMLNEELYDVCCSLSTIRVVGCAVHVAHMGEKRGADRVLVGHLKEKDLIVNGG
jgi:hypothetical protein